MVQGRLDYCNAVLYATSAANLHKLQRIQNSLARIVAGTYKHEHITPVLAKLHCFELSVNFTELFWQQCDTEQFCKIYVFCNFY